MDVEKLLGKLLNEIKGSGGEQFKRKYNEYTKGSKKKYKKKYKHKGGDKYYRESGASRRSSKKSSLIGNLTGNLTSGKGLLTAIGLGVGAYEIYRTSRQPQQSQTITGTGAQAQYAPQSMSGQVRQTPAPPPPPPSSQQRQTQVCQAEGSENAPVSSVPVADTADRTDRASVNPIVSQLDEQDLARRLIQVMAGAAHADGALDGEEEKAILDRLRDADLGQEEKMFLLTELHQPRSIAELTQGVEDIRLGQTMYAVAASAVVIDTENERQWFDELGEALGISPELRHFIEENQ
jgi:uncharacterized membrane protein YebE (DUF533 family)